MDELRKFLILLGLLSGAVSQSLEDVPNLLNGIPDLLEENLLLLDGNPKLLEVILMMKKVVPEALEGQRKTLEDRREM